MMNNKYILDDNDNVVIQSFIFGDNNSAIKFENNVSLLFRNIVAEKTVIGRYSYIGEYTKIDRCVTIGRYCSIANNVLIGATIHPTNWLSTSPFQYDNWLDPNCNKQSWTIGKTTIIGNDVWIGANAIIQSGVTVGDGAIIGSGAIVTKDVPPYAIVVGVPAKILRYRFSKNIIKKLQKIEWWNKPHSEITKLPFNNINQVLNNYKEPLKMNPTLCRILAAFIWNKDERKKFRKKYMRRININKKCSSKVHYTTDKTTLFCSGIAFSGNTATCDFFHNYVDVNSFTDEFWLFKGLSINGKYYRGIARIYDAIKNNYTDISERLEEFKYLCKWWYINYPSYTMPGYKLLTLTEKYVNDCLLLHDLYSDKTLTEKDLKNKYEKDFIELSKKYLSEVMDLFEPEKKIHIFRQALDNYSNIEWQLPFFPKNIKIVRTFRDPRDMWVEMDGFDDKTNWKAKTVEEFIAQTKQRMQIFEYQAPNIMTIRFEELCLNPAIRKQLLEFVGLNENSPLGPQQYFDWQKSSQNIGIYKNFSKQEDIRKIEEAFPELLWKGNK